MRNAAHGAPSCPAALKGYGGGAPRFFDLYEHLRAIGSKLDNEEHFGTFLEALRPLMIDGGSTVRGSPPL